MNLNFVALPSPSPSPSFSAAEEFCWVKRSGAPSKAESVSRAADRHRRSPVLGRGGCGHVQFCGVQDSPR